MKTTAPSPSKCWLKSLSLGLTLAVVLDVGMGSVGAAQATVSTEVLSESVRASSTDSQPAKLFWTTDPIPVFADGEVPQEYQEALDGAHQYAEQFMLSESALFSQLTNESVGFSDDAALYAVANCHGDWYHYALTNAAVLADSNNRTVEQLSATLTGTQGFTRPQAAYATGFIAAFRIAAIFA